MPTFNAKPRLIGATVSLLLTAAFAAPHAALGDPVDPVPLTISPSPADFPKTTAGYQVGREFQVTNEAGEEVGLEGVAIEGTDSGSFVFNGSNCGGPLQPGQKCSVWITFAPADPGTKQAVLAVHVNGHSDETFEISGTAVPAQLSFSPGSYDFGLQYVNRGGNGADFQLTNSGEAAVQLSNLDTVGPDPGVFWTGNSDCWGRWLEPGDSCSVQVYFGPREAVPYAALLRAGVNGETFTAELTGAGGQPVIEADANPAEFGTASVGGAGVVRTVTLTNSGNLPAAFFIAVIAGGDAGSFELLDENCSAAPLGPADSCTARVRFVPADSGPKLARLAFFGETEGGTMVGIRGEGVAPAATLAPSSFDFGSRQAGRRSVPRPFVVRNEGATPLALGASSLIGVDPDQFAVAGDECTDAVLAPGDECRVRVRFAPHSRGAKSARLRVAAEGGAFTAGLSGTARPKLRQHQRTKFGRRMTLAAHRAR
jgi:hypothetical protein